MPTDLKSGMPEAVLMPAPVWNTTLEDCQTNCASSHTFCSNSSGGSKICCPVRAEGSGQNVSHSVKANSHRLICPRLAQRKQKGLEKAACPHVPPLPSTLQDSHLSQGQSYDLPSAQEALHPLPCLLSALPPSFPPAHSAPAIRASCLFLQQARPVAAPGPLNRLYPLTRLLFPLRYPLDFFPPP